MTDDFDGRPLTAKRASEQGRELEYLQQPIVIAPAMKETDNKPKFHLIDPRFELGMAEVLTFGADKYSDENWREGREFTDYISAARRHLNAIERGEDIDQETGKQHAYHLGCCTMFLSEFIRQKPRYAKFDNRHKDPISDRLLRGIAKEN